MRSRIYEFFRMLWDIEKLWDDRKVEDATSEPEWMEYENVLGVMAEFCLGWRNFKGVML